MTVLHLTNQVTRETCSYYRRRSLVVRLHSRHLEIREKGRRDAVPVDYVAIYELALKLRHRREKAEKAAARKGGAK